jgi:hypothetical protein
MMQYAIDLGHTRDCRRGGAGAARRPVRIGDREIEATLEPSPRDAGRVEQVADVLAARGVEEAVTRRADVARRLPIADGAAPGNVTCSGWQIVGAARPRHRAKGVACDEG